MNINILQKAFFRRKNIVTKSCKRFSTISFDNIPVKDLASSIDQLPSGMGNWMGVLKSGPQDALLWLAQTTGSFGAAIIIGSIILRLSAIPINYYSVELLANSIRKIKKSYA